jgi:TRAP-type uncharacterized transport system substrate-binding protein
LLRHTWLVTVLGTVILAGGVWLAFYLTSHGAVMKVAAGPADGVDVRLVELLAKKFAQDGAKIELQLVTTSGPAQSTQAIADRSADLAILPSNVGASGVSSPPRSRITRPSTTLLSRYSTWYKSASQYSALERSRQLISHQLFEE